nr:amino acid adenylation domain-containing protein [Bacillus subtilis]
MSLFEEQELFWDGVFDDEDYISYLPYFKTTVKDDGKRGRVTDSILYVSLPTELSQKIKSVANDSHIAVYIILLSGVECLLNKYTGNENIIIGMPAIKQDIGVLNEILMLKNKINAATTFKTLFKDINLFLKSVTENQNVPFRKMTKNLNIQYNDEHLPIINTVVSLDEIHSSFLNEIGGRDILFQFNLENNRVNLKVVYNERRYDQEYLVQATEHLKQIYTNMLSQPDSRLDQLEYLSKVETDKIFLEFNDTQADYPSNKTIHQLFEQRAESLPNKVAVEFEDKQLTYQELNERANQLARTLRLNGVGSEQLVGIMTERSLEMIIGILGILKAGGGYVPIDPEFPEERIHYILKDSEAQLLLTQSHLMHRVSFTGRVIPLDSEESYHEIQTNLNSIVRPNHLAYVIYTSGTTGKPKGVMIEHKSVVNTLTDLEKRFPLGIDDAILLKTNYTFDVSVTELFGWFIGKSKLVILKPGLEKEPEALINIIEKNKITHINFVPSMLQVLLNELRQINIKKLQSLKYVFSAGEALPVKTIKEFYSALSSRLENIYGPTECTIYATYYGTDRTMKGLVNTPIGKPLGNVQAVVLKDLELQPIGVPGELCISGVGLARGYLNRPDLTAEKFVDHPFIPGEKLYRTGDLARWLPEGNIEYLGRIDHQVKIRGYRIEIGEIETVLLNMEAVQEAIVVAHEDDNGDKALCAYYVASESFAVSEMKEKLSVQMPSYMIPSYFIQLEKMPLTSNGKIDRKALPLPDRNTQTGVKYVAPRTSIELKLVEIWKEVLSLKQVGIRDNFFDLGGHSLRATDLVSKLYKLLKIKVSLRDVFNHPTIEQLSRIISVVEDQSFTSIPAVEQRESYPVSSAQKRMYILHQLEGGELSYNMPNLMVVEGELDVTRLESACIQLIDRHESLRTSFKLLDGELKQLIHDKVNFKVEVRKVRPEDLDEYIQGFIRAFDLKQAPLFRVQVLEFTSTKHMILMDMHHVISDGVSMTVIMQELFQLYEGAQLPELRIQYKDYAVWQQNEMNQEQIRKQGAYWLETLGGDLPVLQMPTDYARPATRNFKGARVEFTIDEHRSEALQQLAMQTGSTLYMVMLSIYTLMLSKYSGQEDIIIGSLIAGRPHADLDRVVGMFVNTLAMRNYPTGEKTFEQFASEVKENALRAYENQDYPFEEIVETLDVTRDMSRNAIFDVMFVLQNMDQEARKVEGLEIKPFEWEYEIAKFDLMLTVVEWNGQLNCMLEYATSLYEEATIVRMTKHFTHLVDNILAHPHTKLSELSMVLEEERMQLLRDFNDTKAEYPRNKTIHQLFEEQAERVPDKVAVVFEDKQLTYRELNERANQLARTLRNEGVEAEQLVGIMTERSLEMIVGILGILKAGGAYVPIDPEYPEERIRYMIEDSGVKLLLKQSHKQHIEFTGTVLNLDQESNYHKNSLNLENHVQSNNLAYVIYTSGTTGAPKGTLLEHKNVVRLLFNSKNVFDFNEKDTWTLFHSFCFDFSVWEMYGALLYGGKLVIVPKTISKNPIQFLQLLKDEEVTILNQTPSYFYLVKDQELTHSSCDLKVRKVIFGGESLNPSLLKEWKDKYPDIKLINMYGITETTVHVTYKEITEIEIKDGRSNIGKPIPTLNAYILNEQKELQPIGIQGELYIAGEGLARGYLNRPDLTAEKFVDHPFIPGEKLYRTGDLARWLPEGNIEYLGRIDHQVKIRGYRIEIGEIETALLNMEAVQEAIVVAHENDNGDKALCAYYVASESFAVSEMKEKLSVQMPSYMLPSYFIQLEKMPLTSNGKIDRKELPLPDEKNIQTGVEYVAPRTPIETKLAEIWKDILDIKQVGIQDNFFDIGGDSLKVLKLIQSIKERMRTEISFQTVFNAQTIELLALDLMNGNIKLEDETKFTPITHRGNVNVFCFPSRIGIGMTYIEMAYLLEGDYRIYITDFIHDHTNFDDMIREYAENIVQIQEQGPYVFLGYSGGGNIAFEVAKVMKKKDWKCQI